MNADPPTLSPEDIEHIKDSLDKSRPAVAAACGCRLALLAVENSAPRTCRKCSLGRCKYGFTGIPEYKKQPTVPAKTYNVGVIRGTELRKVNGSWSLEIMVATNFPAEGNPVEIGILVPVEDINKRFAWLPIETMQELRNSPCIYDQDDNFVRLIKE